MGRKPAWIELCGGALLLAGCGILTTVDRDSIPVETGVASGGGVAPSECVAEEGCPLPPKTCLDPACLNGSCGYVQAAEGSVCADGGMYCDNFGGCVECLQDNHCGPNARCENISKTCKPLACFNGSMGGTESDVDCGGSCDACADGLMCNDRDDCQSGFCDQLLCAPCQQHSDCPLTDFCGPSGSCIERRPNGASCIESEECVGQKCVDGTCCDHNCDGTCQSCALMGTEGTCSFYAAETDPEAECAADVCGGNNACRCADGLFNGAETDVDCGGGTCALCLAGDTCQQPSDCASVSCSTNVCD